MKTFLSRLGLLGATKKSASMIAPAHRLGASSTGTDAHPRDQYVFVEDDSTARELEPDEVVCLNTKFEGADGNRPYIKFTYEQRTPDNRLRGYLAREKLPTSIRIKTVAEATPVETVDDAIRIAKLELPISFCVKSGTRLERMTDPRTGKTEFGLPGVDVSRATFNGTLSAGVWRVVRTPHVSASDREQACFVDVSAASGRVMQFGWLP